MRKITMPLFCLLAILIGIAMLLTACSPASTSVKIAAPAAPSVKPGDTLEVPVTVANINDMVAMEIHLSFDPKLLEVQELKNGDILKADFTVQNQYDNSAGSIDYAIAQIGEPPSSGSGNLFVIVFRVKSSGEAVISFRKTPAAPDGALFSDSKGQAITVALTNGTLVIK